MEANIVYRYESIFFFQLLEISIYCKFFKLICEYDVIYRIFLNMLYDNFFIYLYHICGGVIEKCFWISILLVSYMFYWLKYYYIDICLLIYMSWDKKEKKKSNSICFL